MRWIISLLFLLLLIVVLLHQAKADTPRNNKFGMHLASPVTEDDLKKVAEIVNSSGGEWGYVTVIIQEDDRDKDKWQGIFNQMRRLRLIPIVRLATKPEGPIWRRPDKIDADAWVHFLDGMLWPVRSRYIILFNEVNHGNEWGGATDPGHYAETAYEFATKLKQKNKDFKIMLAGFDTAAPSRSPNYEDEAIFIQQMLDKVSVEQWNEVLDGWSSHSYPTGFVGAPNAWGRRTVRTYDWELQYLSNLGFKELPVFITETGWDADLLGSRELVAEYISQAYMMVWIPDDRVVAVTPFVFNFQGPPFLGFSWLEKDTLKPYPQCNAIRALPKMKGEPEIIDGGKIQVRLPHELTIRTPYEVVVTILNSGQAFWSPEMDYRVEIENLSTEDYQFDKLPEVAPKETKNLKLTLNIREKVNIDKIRVVFKKGEKLLFTSAWQEVEVVALPSLKFKTQLYSKLNSEGGDYSLQILSIEDNKLIWKKNNIKVDQKGEGVIGELENVVLGQTYRLVINKPYYLPRQVLAVLHRGENYIEFKRMYPFDLNNNGYWDLTDFVAPLTNFGLFGLYWPW